MSCLSYLKWIGKKNRTFDIECIVKWDGKINKVIFWGIKKLKFLASPLWML